MHVRSTSYICMYVPRVIYACTFDELYMHVRSTSYICMYVRRVIYACAFDELYIVHFANMM